MENRMNDNYLKKKKKRSWQKSWKEKHWALYDVWNKKVKCFSENCIWNEKLI